MLIFLFFFLSLEEPDPNITFDDIVFVVWSGKECIGTRIRELAKSWYNLIPEVHVYTDYIDEKEADIITNENPHLKIIFHCTEMRGDYLIGSAFENPYNHAQSRHLLSIVDIYGIYPNKKWYFFCDDDCYVIPNRVLDLCKRLEGKLFGQTFYFIEETYKFFPSKDPTRTFQHGGPGVIMANDFISSVVPYIMDCNSIYQCSIMGSDIKLSACYGRIFGLREWYYRKDYSTNTFGYFNSNRPEHNIQWGGIPEHAMTYHLILPPDTILIRKSHYSEWKDNKNRSLYVDWGDMMMQDMQISLGHQDYEFQFNFWYSIRKSNFLLYPLDTPKPIFSSKDKEREMPIAYEQEYPGNLTVRVNCDQNKQSMDPYQDGFLSIPRSGPVIYMKCPYPQEFKINHIEHIEPTILTIPADHK